MTGNTKIWRAPLAGLASVAMIATMGMAAATANADSPQFKVTFDLQGRGTADHAEQTLKVESTRTDSYKLKPNTVSGAPAGWTFTGWYTEPGLGEGEKVDFSKFYTGDMTVYAHWAETSKVNTVTFSGYDAGYFTAIPDTNQDGTPEPADMTIDLAPGDKLASWEVPTADKVDGDIVEGWTVRGTGTEFTADAEITGDVTLDADVEKGYIVTFSSDSNAIAFSGEPSVDYKVEVKEGKVIPSAPNAVQASSNKAITEWKYDADDLTNATSVDTPFQFGRTQVKANYTLKATTTALTTQMYQVSYMLNPAVTTVNPVYVAAGKSAPTDLSVLNDAFTVAWTYGSNTEYKGEVVSGIASSNALALTGTLTPKGVKTEEVTVRFDPNYTGSKVSEVKADKGTVLSAPTPTRDGYVFMGWYKSADPASQKVSAYDKSSNTEGYVDFTGMKIEDAKAISGSFYAGWLKDDNVTKIVSSYNYNAEDADEDAKYFTAASLKAYKEAYNKAVSDAKLTSAEDAALKDGATLAQVAKFTDTKKADALLKGLQSAQALLKAKSTVPVYRVFNKDTNKHLYTTDAAEAAGLMAAGWRSEGVAFNVANKESADSEAAKAGLYVPVYRLFNKYDASGKQIDRHFYTSDKAEYEKLVADPSWRDEGIAYYVRTQGGETVYRAYSSDRYEHLFTTNKTEAQNAVKLYGYRDEGVAFNAE